MNNVIANFNQVLDFAKEYNLPLSKKRGILREYLQCKILDIFYHQEIFSKMIFTGGTGLRLIRNLDRFSEDLDFDLEQDTAFSDIDKLMQKIFQRLEKENFSIDFYQNKTGKKSYYEFRFQNLLQELNISQHKQEKLTIKFDFEKFWQAHQKEVLLLNRYGFLVNVITLPLDQQLVQKFTAYIKRKQTQPRDIYDIIWLISHQAKIDSRFAGKNNISGDLVSQALKKFEKEKPQLQTFKKRLKPFLIDEEYIDKLKLFPQLVGSVDNFFI